MALTPQSVQASIDLDGSQALNELGKLQNESKQLGKELTALQRTADRTKTKLAVAPTDSKAAKKYSDELKDINKKLNERSAALDKNAVRIDEIIKREGYAAISTSKLRNQYNALKREIDTTVLPLDQYKAKLAEIHNLHGIINKRRLDLTPAKSAFDSIKSQFPAALAGGIAGGVVGLATAGFSALLSLVTSIIPPLKKLSDEVADVQIALNLTEKEAEKLNQELGKIDTRTPTEQLRQMAVVAGDLNVPIEQVKGFIESVNQANIAFGRDFGGNAEEVATRLGKIKGLFSETAALTYAEAISKIGSAFKILNDDGPATTNNIIDFVTRVGQIPEALRPSIQDTAVFAAVLEEAGITAERGASGFIKLLTESIKNSGPFIKFLNVTKKEFEDLINKNPGEFIVKLAEKLKGLSNVQIGNVLKGLGLNDAEALSVLGALSQNLDKVAEKQKAVNKGFDEGNRLAEVAAIKENTLAGQLERLQKLIGKAFNESGLREGLRDMVKGFIKAVTEAKPLLDILFSLGEIIGDVFSRFAAFLNLVIQAVTPFENLSQIFRAIGQAIGLVVLAFKFMNDTMNLTAYTFDVLINKAKEFANFFGGSFKIDPTLTFDSIIKKQQELLKNSGASFQSLFLPKKDNSGTTVPGVPNPIPPPTNGPPTTIPNFDDPKKNKAKTPEQLATEALQIELTLSQKRIELIADEQERKEALLSLAATREIEAFKGTGELKAEFERLVTRKLVADIAEIRKEADEKAAKEAKEFIKRTADYHVAQEELAAEAILNNERSTTNQRFGALTRLLNAKLAQNDAQYASELVKAKISEEEKELLYKEYLLRKEKLLAEHADKMAGIEEKDKQLKKKLQEEDKQAIIDITSSVADATSSIIAANYERQANAAERKNQRQLAQLERDYAQRLVSEETYQAAKTELERQGQEQVAKFRRKQAIAERAAAIFSATINGILAVQAQLAKGNVLGAIAVGVAAGSQVVKILATPIPQFAEGGFTDALNPNKKKNGFLAVVGEKGNEYIIPNRLLQQPQVANMVSEIENLRLRGQTQTTAPQAQRTTPNAPVADPVSLALLEAVSQLNQTLQSGIKAKSVWEWNEFKDGFDLIEDIQKSAQITKR